MPLEAPKIVAECRVILRNSIDAILAVKNVYVKEGEDESDLLKAAALELVNESVIDVGDTIRFSKIGEGHTIE